MTGGSELSSLICPFIWEMKGGNVFITVLSIPRRWLNSNLLTNRKQEPGVEIKTKLEWDDKALEATNEIPSDVRTMVVEMVEDLMQKEGFKRVTYENFLS